MSSSSLPPASGPARRDTLNLRISSLERQLIERAAQALGTTRTDFILRAARRAAEDTLLERSLYVVTPEAYEAFLLRLEAPALPNAALTRALQTPTPWTADE